MLNRNSQQDNLAVSILPKDLPNPSAATQPQMVTAYFIGVKVMHPVYEYKTEIDDAGNIHKVKTSNLIGWGTPLLVIKGRPYQMPEVGESIRVTESVYRELKSRLQWPEKNIIYEGITDDPTLASAIKKAFIAADRNPKAMKDVDVGKFSAQIALAQMTDEQLALEMERRALLRTPEPQTVVEDEVQAESLGSEDRPVTKNKVGK